MPASADELFARLDALGIVTTTIHHPPVHTVEEAKRLRGPITGGHCKNLFLRDKKGRMWLVVMLEDATTDLKQLGGLIGARHLSFCGERRLGEFLGVAPGSVTPFALINDRDNHVVPVLDEAMLRVAPLNFHPLRNDMTTAIQPTDLLGFIASCGHAPMVLDVAGAR